MTAARPVEPMLLRLNRWAELHVLNDADTEEIVLQFDPPDATTEAPFFETRLTINDTLELIERLQTAVSRLEEAKAAA